jgi:hypothetical protein
LAIGIFYIILVQYTGYTPRLFIRWKSTSAPTGFYAFAVVALALRLIKKPLPDVLHGVLAEIGKASYHILLTQQLFYHFGLGTLIPLPGMVFFNIIVCCAVGVAFSRLDEKFLQQWVKRTFLTRKAPAEHQA